MSTQAFRHSTVARSADLLPWADPYIVQLFAEAELIQQDENSEQAWEESPAVQRVVGSTTVVEAVLTRDAWRITSLRRPSISRRRRTESVPPLAPC